MGCQSEVTIGDYLTFSICTHDPDTGALTDADSAPAYRVYEDETGTAILTGTMTKLDDANTLGFYTERIECSAGNGFEDGKSYTVYIEATVDSDTGGIAYAFRAATLSAATIADAVLDEAKGAHTGLLAKALPDAAPDAAGGLPISDAGGLDLDGLLADATADITLTGTATGGSSTTIVLTGGVATDGYYDGQIVVIVGGTGVGQARTILAYVAAGTEATVTRDWATAPANGSEFMVLAADMPAILEAGTARGGSSSSITLDAGASSISNTYKNNYIMITAGTGIGQCRLISNYVGSSKIASVIPDWTTTPAAGSVYQVLPAARVDVGGWAGALATLSPNNKPDVNVNEWHDVLLATTNPLPNAAPDAAGGLPVSDAGGLDLDAILADTNELQTDDIPGTIAALNDLSAAEVNAQVVDALNTDTYAEPGQGAPAATASLAAKIGYLYKAFRNKLTQNATTLSVYNDAGDTVDQKATVSDDGTTFTRGEIGTGP